MRAMTKLNSAVRVVMVMAALACGDSGDDDAGNTAGTGGMAGAAAGMGGVAGMAGTAGAGGTAGGGAGAAGAMAGTGGGAGMGSNCVGPISGEPQPTFSWFYDNIVPNCAGPLCHSSVAGGNLVFDTKDNAYAQLMMAGMGMNLGASTNPTNCVDAGMMRVVPNNPDMSLLYNKIRTDMDPPCGNRMPTGSTLCASTIEAVRMWIMAGAQNN